MPSASDEEKRRMMYISIYDYWMYGVNLKEDFFYHFHTKTHEEKNSYVTFRNRFLYTHHLNDEQYAFDLLEDKYNCYLRFKDYFLRDVICIETENDYETFVNFTKKHPTFVVKPLTLGFGWGIHTQSVSDNDNLHDIFLKILSEGTDIQNQFHIKTHTTKFVLEELIDQAEELSCFHPNSVNCVRLTTIVKDGKVHFFYPWIKIGRNNNFISNAGNEGICVGIDERTGVCITDARDEFNNIYTEHPNTHIVFKGYKIPQWESLLALGEKLALELSPRINYVGWDMAYTNEGWSVLEANPEGEFLAQFIFEKGLKNELEELMSWKPAVDFWWEDPISTKIQ